MISAEIITIGNELLYGKLIDTNSTLISHTLSEIGINVIRKTSIGDDINLICNTIEDETLRVNLKVFSGGLGPTHDDRTKEAVCRSFSSELVINKNVLSHIERLFAKRNLAISQTNIDQALVPDNAEILMNDTGTAPGLVLEKDKTLFIFLPAVPFELKFLMHERVIPLLHEKFKELKPLHSCDFIFSGVGESALYEILKSKTQFFNSANEFAFLPSPGFIRFRHIIHGETENDAEMIFEETDRVLKEAAGKFYYGYGAESVAELALKKCTSKGLTFSVAESCTGGFIAHLITEVSGSSKWFMGGIVSYSNQSKINLLNVDEKILEIHGAVSEEVVKQMASACRERFSSDYAAAVSGIAGPDGGTPEKPVGTAWIALAVPGFVKTKQIQSGLIDRSANIQRVAIAALILLLEELK